VVNEGGGRGTTILDDLTSQTAYLQAMLRHDAKFIERLSSIIDNQVAEKRRERGNIGERATILHCGPIRNVCIGAFAQVQGVQSLENGTILSCKEHRTEVGGGVSAHHFILSEGARVDGAVMLDKAFVGQGVKLGKQFSAENSLFFANSEGSTERPCRFLRAVYRDAPQIDPLDRGDLLVLQCRERHEPEQPYVQARAGPSGSV